MNLYFKDSSGKEKLLLKDSTKDEIWTKINKHLKKHKVIPHYQRMFFQGGRVWIDYGSHTDFFIVDGATINDLMSEQKQEG